jgi:hypothetical protein
MLVWPEARVKELAAGMSNIPCSIQHREHSWFFGLLFPTPGLPIHEGKDDGVIIKLGDILSSSALDHCYSLMDVAL